MKEKEGRKREKKGKGKTEAGVGGVGAGGWARKREALKVCCCRRMYVTVGLSRSVHSRFALANHTHKPETRKRQQTIVGR